MHQVTAMNIFEQQEKKKKRRQRFWFAAFYGPFLYFFALLIATKKSAGNLCFFSLFCADSGSNVFYKALVLYLYLLTGTAGLVYIYKGIEKLAGKKYHLAAFQVLLVVLPILFIAFMAWKEPVWETRHYLFALFFALTGILGLIMIETRPKK